MKVFIVLLNWNGCRDTSLCLDSLSFLEKSDLFSKFIIVVDNGSSDDSVSVLGELNKKFDFILLKSSENLGFSGGNNIGIQYALNNKADFIWLLNNDTIVDEKSLQEMVTLMLANHKVGVVGSSIFFMDSPHELQSFGGGKIYGVSGHTRNYISEVPDNKIDYLTGCSLLVRREVFESVGLLNDDYFFLWEDVEFSQKVKKYGWCLSVASKSLVYHKASSSVKKSSPLQTYYYNKGAVQFFKNNSPFWLVPVGIGCSCRLIKRIVYFDFRGVLALLKGVASGFFDRGIHNEH